MTRDACDGSPTYRRHARARTVDMQVRVTPVTGPENGRNELENRPIARGAYIRKDLHNKDLKARVQELEQALQEKEAQDALKLDLICKLGAEVEMLKREVDRLNARTGEK